MCKVQTVNPCVRSIICNAKQGESQLILLMKHAGNIHCNLDMLSLTGMIYDILFVC